MSKPAPGQSTHDPVVRRVHWLNAILALLAIMSAWGISGAPRHGAARGWLIVLHGSLGLTILGATLFWAGWRLGHPPPPLRPVMNTVETVLARTIQAALVLLFVAMPISGYLSLAAAGKSVSFFGLVDVPPLVAESGRLSQAAFALHLLGEFLIYGLVALHIAAALQHALIRRDGIMERMLPRRP